jgi:precorrin-6Y C5,15-methyltransferase (decarboxylating)
MLHVIGLSVDGGSVNGSSVNDGTGLLTPEACAVLYDAALVIGSNRQLALVEHLWQGLESRPKSKPKPRYKPATLELPKLKQLKAVITPYLDQGQSVVVLASGDPLFYGIGRWLGRQGFQPEQLQFYPAVSSVQVVCHRLGLSLQDVEVVSLHGRPLNTLRRHLKQRSTLVLLTDSKSYPQAIAQLCLDTGFTDFELTLCENLGYPQEQIRRYKSTYPESTYPESDFLERTFLESICLERHIWPDDDVAPLHITVLRLNQVDHSRGYLPEFPGIADADFITHIDKQVVDEQVGSRSGAGSIQSSKGRTSAMLTKREVRLGILSLLQLGAEETLWDIGAGCGGVAVELSFWQPRAQVFAVEHHPERFACLEANRQRFGVSANLIPVQGRAPDVLAELPPANKVFIGGSDGELSALLTRCWQQLPEHGVLVASAVTENSRQTLLRFLDDGLQGQCETLQIAVSKGDQLAGQLLYRPALPVTLFKFSKHRVKRNQNSGAQGL